MKKLTVILPFIVTFFEIGCNPTPSACVKGYLDFETPTFVLGTVYNSPGFLYNSSNGLAVALIKFTSVAGSQTFNQSKILQPPPFPFGTGNVLRMNNTALNFDLKQGTQKASFEYLDQGGTINLGAHGSGNLYIGNMSALPVNIVINGVTIDKSNVHDILNAQGTKVGETGTITLKFSPDIGGMIIGGQELFLDNFCFN